MVMFLYILVGNGCTSYVATVTLNNFSIQQSMGLSITLTVSGFTQKELARVAKVILYSQNSRSNLLFLQRAYCGKYYCTKGTVDVWC